MTQSEIYMHRCSELALLGSSYVAPNPMVGAVLVHDDRIIGEGYHMQYGQAHAEPNCIASVKNEDRHLIEQSTMYVSLEPCAHFGKTPPCADLIISKRIPKVIIGCRDPFVQVNGRGIEKLKAAGIEVEVGALEKECKELNKRFFCFNTEHRPYIILKWAETSDGKIAAPSNSPNGVEVHPQSLLARASNINYDAQKSEDGEGLPSPVGGNQQFGTEFGKGAGRLLISNPYSNRLVHKWRSEEMAILVGTNTALLDDPELTTRLWPGKSPIRLVVDMNLRLPKHLKLFSSGHPTIVFNLLQHTLPEKIDILELQKMDVSHYQVTEDVSLIHQIINALYQLKIQSVMVEGGAQLLQSFIDEGMWDEARVICNEELIIGTGLPAPILKNHQVLTQEKWFSDSVSFYSRVI